jgi:hypothetical protein
VNLKRISIKNIVGVLEKILSTSMLPSDEKDLLKAVNSLQITLPESKSFKDTFGPASTSK